MEHWSLVELKREIPWRVTAAQGYCVDRVKHLTVFLVSRKGQIATT